jgi:PAS domain S-box-containing protein
VDALRAASDHHCWLLPDGTPCRDGELPLHRAIWRGAATRGERLLLRDASGRERSLVLDAAPLPSRRSRAILTLRAAEPWEAASTAGGRGAPGQHERLFEEGAVPMILTSQSGTILEVNARAREVLRAHEKEIVGAPLGGLLADEALPAYHEAVASLANSGKARAQLTLLAQPDLALEAHAREIRGERPFVQWVLHDVTPHVATERLRRDLVDLLLHDLRSPLATSTLGVETAERSLERDDPGRARRSLAMVTLALRRLARLVDSLLDLSRLEAGHPIVRPAEVQPAELLLAAAAEMEPMLAAQQVHLELDIAADLPAIVADGDMLYRAALNLLDNAVKFSPHEGAVQLRATAQDRGLLLCVTDEGPGVPRELQPRIFDKFIGQYLPNAPRGYGLGLSFCKLAAEAHGGWLAVDSTLGQGSTFALWVPVDPGIADEP